jgi:hypothetical protein
MRVRVVSACSGATAQPTFLGCPQKEKTNGKGEKQNTTRFTGVSSLGDAHRGSVYIRVFIGVNARACFERLLRSHGPAHIPGMPSKRKDKRKREKNRTQPDFQTKPNLFGS